MPSYESLTPVDANFLYGETATTPMNMGSLSIFEGGPFFDADGRFRLEQVRGAVEAKLHQVPRYRKRVMEVPFGIAHPVLVDDERFDIANHVRVMALPKPGDTAQLKELYAGIHEGMLDRTKPLWQMTFIEGLEGGRVGLVQKTHHGLIDGITSMDVMGLLLDSEPDPVILEAPQFIPVPAPDPAALATEMMARQQADAADVAAGPYGLMSQQSPEQVEELQRALESMRDLGPLTKTSLNCEIGPRRRYDWHLTTIAAVKGLRDLVPGATVNDVMIAVVSAALRDLLESRGEDVDALEMRAFVPVSLRVDSERGTGGGNRVSGFVVALPVSERDPVRRLEAVHKATADLKENKQAVGIRFLTQLHGFTPPILMAQAGRQAMQQATFANLTITNVPGPQRQLYFMGAELLELHPMVLIGNQLTLNVAIMSYNGALSIGLCADYDANPDLDVTTRGVERGLAELVEATRPDGLGPIMKR
ncbi:MAG: acyltransferase [Solirubrobacterales bacterium]|nr:acyltransferase [Solirubrobacterales bacterium]